MLLPCYAASSTHPRCLIHHCSLHPPLVAAAALAAAAAAVVPPAPTVVPATVDHPHPVPPASAPPAAIAVAAAPAATGAYFPLPALGDVAGALANPVVDKVVHGPGLHHSHPGRKHCQIS